MSALIEARESLSYWETRARTLPRRAVRKRREARAMAARWRARVSEAERLEYGAGVLGAVLMLVSERRLPVGASRTARQVVRAGVWTAAALAVLAVAAVAAVFALAVALVL